MIEIETDLIYDHFQFRILDLFLYDGECGFEIDTTGEKIGKFIDKVPCFFWCDATKNNRFCFFPSKVSWFFSCFYSMFRIIEQLLKKSTIESTIWLYKLFFSEKHRFLVMGDFIH